MRLRAVRSAASTVIAGPSISARTVPLSTRSPSRTRSVTRAGGERKAKSLGRNAAPETTARSRQTIFAATRAAGPKTARDVMSSPSSAKARVRRSSRAAVRDLGRLISALPEYLTVNFPGFRVII
jgi:hypothetical protein